MQGRRFFTYCSLTNPTSWRPKSLKELKVTRMWLTHGSSASVLIPEVAQKSRQNDSINCHLGVIWSGLILRPRSQWEWVVWRGLAPPFIWGPALWILKTVVARLDRLEVVFNLGILDEIMQVWQHIGCGPDIFILLQMRNAGVVFLATSCLRLDHWFKAQRISNRGPRAQLRNS